MSVISDRLEGTTNRRPHAEPTAPVVPEARDRTVVDIVHQAPGMLWLPWPLAATTIGIGVVALVGLYWDAAAAAVGIWYESSTYNHGFLIPFICAYLGWTRRRQLAALVPRANYWGLATIALLGFGWLLGHLASVLVVQQFALVAMVQALFLTILGWRVTAVIGFPLLYLFFAVPVGEFLIPPLQDLTAAFIVAGLRLTGIPVFLDGVLIEIPTGSFEVARACAGVRYLIATLALGVLVAGTFYHSWPRRLVFVGLSIMVPIVANGLRAYGIVMIAHLSEYRLAVAVDHVVYGWVFFGFVTLVLLLLAASIRERGAPDGQAVPLPAVPAVTSPRPPAGVVFAGAGAVLAAAAAPAYSWFLEADTGATKVTDLPVPAVEAPWVPIVETDADWKPIFPGAGAELLQRYGAGERTVDLYIAYYPQQRQGTEVAGWQNKLADADRWTRLGGGYTETVVDSMRSKIAYTRFRSGSATLLVWHWFWVDRTVTGSPHVAKILSVKQTLLGSGRAAAFVAIAARYDETPAEAARVMREFLGRLAPLDTMLESLARQEPGPHGGEGADAPALRNRGP